MDSRPPDAPRFWGRAPQRGQGGLWSLVQMALCTGPAPLGSVKLGSWSVLPGPALAAPQEVGCHPSGRKGGGKMARCARRITSSGDNPAQGVSTPLLWGQGAAQAGGATCPASVSLVLCVCRTVA